MKKTWHAIWFLLPAVALCQNAAQPMDIFESGGGPVQPAFQKLYELTAQMTQDPSSFYNANAEADQSDFPTPTQITAQYDAAWDQGGNALTTDQRNFVIPCAAHLKNAISAMEVGYRIKETQTSPLAAKSVLAAYTRARQEFAKCNALATGAEEDNTPASTSSSTPATEPPYTITGFTTGGNGASPGSSPGGVPNTNSGGTPGTNNGGTPTNTGGTPTNNSGGTPTNTPGNETFPIPWDPGSTVVGLSCSYNVQNDSVPGADPPIAYQTGFNQAVAKCLQSQCTLGNLALVAGAAKYKLVAAILNLSVVPAFMNVVFNPPEFSKSPDPYTRGTEEGTALCNYALQVATFGGSLGALASKRLPPVVPVERMNLTPAPSIPEPPSIPGNPVVGGQKPPPLSQPYNPQQAAAAIAQWIKNINPSGCTKNCGIATINAIRAMFGEILQAAPATENGMTEAEMAKQLGTPFIENGLTDQQMGTYLNGLPEGTVTVIGVNIPNQPGHFFWSIKYNGQTEFWDAQTGMPMQGSNNPAYMASLRFDINVVGNPFHP